MYIKGNMENESLNNDLRKINSFFSMGSGSSTQIPSDKKVKKFNKNELNSLKNRSSSVGNLKGSVKSKNNNHNGVKRERGRFNSTPSSTEISITKFKILSNNCITNNERDLEQLNMLSTKIMQNGLGIILSIKYRNNYIIDIIEEITQSKKLWNAETVELLMPQIIALLMSKNIKNKLMSLKLIERILREFNDIIISNNQVGKKIKEGLLQISVNEHMININCDKNFKNDLAFIVKEINSL
uniref:Katanin_con80 domain-containing protein n=1 Tax=Parastrongyloides trichosuri TaxID=131310 RepID=A0A0N4Z1T8_PARTI